MGNIPEYQRRPVVEAPQDPTLSARAQQTGQVGQMVSGLASDASTVMHRAQMQREQMQIKDYLRRANMQLAERINRFEQISRKEHQSDPYKAIPSFEKEMARAQKELSKNAPFPSAAKMFAGAAKEVEIRSKDKMWNWADNQALENDVNGVKLEGKAIDTEVYRNPTPKSLEGAFELIENATRDLVNTISPDAREKMIRDMRGSSTMSMFAGVLDNADHMLKAGPLKGESENAWIRRINNQMQVAQGHLDSGKFDEVLGAEGVTKVQNQIKRLREKKGMKAADYSELKFKNPYKYLRKTNQGYTALDPANQDSVLQRIQARPEFEKKNGIVLPLMAPEEKMKWMLEFERAEPSLQKQKLEQISQYPEKIAREFVNELFPDRPEYAAAVRSNQIGNPEAEALSNKIIESSDFLRKNKDTKAYSNILPEQKKVLEYLDKLVGPSVKDAYSKQALYTAGMSAVVDSRRKAGRSGKRFGLEDKESFKSAVSEMGLVPYERNKQFIKRPQNKETKKFADDERMKLLFNNINQDMLEKSQGSKVYNRRGELFDIDAAVDRIVFEPAAGSKGYLLFFANDNLLNKNGEPYILDFNRLDSEPGLVRRKGMMERASDFLNQFGTSGKQ